MADSVLIVTSSPGLGEVVRRTLVESGRYEVMLSTNALHGIQQTQVYPFSIAILDVDLDKDRSGVPLLKLGLSLREINPLIHMIALSASNDPYDPAIKALSPEGIITTPLYPGSILRTVDRVAGASPGNFAAQVSPPEPPAPTREDEPPVWLQDVTIAAQYLTRLSLETASQAALIVSQKRLWAYAGELPQPAAQELADTVARYWGRNGESDLARFVRLDSDGGEYLLYATALGSGMVLALVFGVETPFSKIRSQVVKLARLLASPPPTGKAEASPQAGFPPSTADLSSHKDAMQEELIEERPLFSDIPSPSPESRQASQSPDRSNPLGEGDSETLEPFSQSAKKNVFPGRSMGASSPQMEKTRPIPTLTSEQGLKTSEFEDWELVPTPAGLYRLTYGILLIPRLPGHHLIGDLADRLPMWISQLCVAFDWRLEHISVRPDYLQWNVSTAPEIPPGQIIRNIREHSSQRIFDEFPVLGRDNPSGDFWATGFLLITGSLPPSGKLVQEFIRQTRHRQGISRSVSRQNR
jgi:REP element-mobilizing transposase RayT